MAWTTIPDANLEPDKPARSVDALALRDNPIAIANGDSGAPKVQPAGLHVIAAADTVQIWGADQMDDDTLGYLGVYDFYTDRERSVGFRVHRSGSIRVKLDQSAPSGGNNWVRVLKNGVQQVEWTTFSSTPTARSVDVTVSAGDIISVQGHAQNPGFPFRIANLGAYANKTCTISVGGGSY